MDCFSYGVVLWEIVTKERSQRGNWRPVRVPEECPAEVEALLKARQSLLPRRAQSEHAHARPSQRQIVQCSGILHISCPSTAQVCRPGGRSPHS